MVMLSTFTPSTSATSDTLSANSYLFVTFMLSGSLISNPPTLSGLNMEVIVSTCMPINSPGSGTSPVAKVYELKSPISKNTKNNNKISIILDIFILSLLNKFF